MNTVFHTSNYCSIVYIPILYIPLCAGFLEFHIFAHELQRIETRHGGHPMHPPQSTAPTRRLLSNSFPVLRLRSICLPSMSCIPSPKDHKRNPPPSIFLLVENRRKSNNLGPELRCASAFGIDTMITVGFNKCADYGSHGASKHVKIIAFPTTEQAVQFASVSCKCESIVGLLGCLPGGYSPVGYEVHHDGQFAKAYLCDPPSPCGGFGPLSPRSSPVNLSTIPCNNTCLVVGKQSAGLPLDLARHCTKFVHIAHAIVLDASSPFPLLSPPSFLSIALHHITEKLGYSEHEFQGHKFRVNRAKPNLDEGFAAEQQLRRREAREQHRIAVDALGTVNVLADIFDDGDE